MADEAQDNETEEAKETPNALVEEETQEKPPEVEQEPPPAVAEPPQTQKPPTPPVQESSPEPPEETAPKADELPLKPADEQPARPIEELETSTKNEPAKGETPQEVKKDVETTQSVAPLEHAKRRSGEIDPESLMPPVITPPLKGKRQSLSKDAYTFPQRKQKGGSRTRLILGSIVDIKSTVQADYPGAPKVVKYANSYRLEAENPFNHEKVERILKEVLSETLEGLTYDPERCAAQAKNASKTIRQKVKQLEFDRYKIVSMVTIGEKNSQDVFVTCRGLWDIEKDRYSTYALENTQVYGIAYCFGIYYE